MPPEEVLELIRKRPFVPFRIYVSDGKTYDIRHPELVMPGKRSIAIGLPENSEDPFYTRIETVALLHVTRLKPLEDEPVSAS